MTAHSRFFFSLFRPTWFRWPRVQSDRLTIGAEEKQSILNNKICFFFYKKKAKIKHTAIFKSILKGHCIVNCFDFLTGDQPFQELNLFAIVKHTMTIENELKRKGNPNKIKGNKNKKKRFFARCDWEKEKGEREREWEKRVIENNIEWFVVKLRFQHGTNYLLSIHFLSFLFSVHGWNVCMYPIQNVLSF